MNLISINEAAAKGIERLRRPIWAIPEDHLKIDIVEGGKPGPWTHLYSPMNHELAQKDPMDVSCLHLDYEAKEYLEYTGPHGGSEEYKEACRS